MSCRRTVALKERSSSLCRYRKSSEAADIRTLLFRKSYKHGSSDTPSGPVAAENDALCELQPALMGWCVTR